MKLQPTISIIVPVYNVEKYIRPCLDSIIVQTFTDWECILVDDGSKDNSGKICDEYADHDVRFSVIHKKNEGVSIARQTGLDHSKGIYVIHADPDDWVEKDWLMKLHTKIEEEHADMVICDFERIFIDKTVRYVQKPTSFDNNEILQDLLEEKLWGPCWNKLIRRNCFEQFHISFHPEMNLWEDLYVTCMLIANGIKVTYIPEVLYHYDSSINENSIVMHRTDDQIRSCMIFIDTVSKMLSSQQFDGGWFHMKSRVKEFIFCVKNSKYSILTTYSEINERYIHEAKAYHLWSEKGSIALCLKGYPLLGHMLFRVANQLRRILRS